MGIQINLRAYLKNKNTIRIKTMKFMGYIAKTFILSLTIIAQVHFAYAQTVSTASILPPAKTTFLDQNGKPLTGGTVQFSIPGTTTPKTTWQDAAETIPNTNPVVLDSAGRALILGSGSYRQQVFDRNHNLIWDQVTASPASSGGGGGGTATGDGDLVGTIKPWAGMTAPNQYMFAAGQQISRALFPALFTAITSSQQVICSNGNATLSGLTDTTNFWIGMTVEVSCLASGSSTIVSKTATTVTLATAPNVNTNVAAVFFPWGDGNGTTTFTLPDLRGQVIAGNNNMGGNTSPNLTTQFFGATDPNSIGALGGSQSVSTTLLLANLPPITSTGAATTGGTNFVTATGANNFAISGGAGTTLPTGVQLSNSEPVTTTSTGTTSAPIVSSVVQPTKTANYIIKVTPDQNSATASGVTSLGLMTGDIACGAGMTCTGNVISSTAPSSATSPIVLDGTGNISCPTCATTVSAANPVVASRAIAQTLNLAGLNGLTTLGYATAGDGGGATFQHILSGNFIDSSVVVGECGLSGGCTISNVGSGCAAATYNGVTPTGGSGTGLQGVAAVASGFLSTFTITGVGGNKYQVGDVLTLPSSVIPCTVQPTITISNVTTPHGSFTDAVGDKFQIVVDQGNHPNAAQFGAVGDWTHSGGDAAATDNFPFIQNLLQFAGYNTGGTTSDAAGSQGTTAIIPKGTYKVCVGSGTLLEPSSVVLAGLGAGNTILKQCDSDAASAHFVTLGDPTTHQACFYNKIKDIELFTGSGAANSNVAMIYTNCAQQLHVVEHVAVYPGFRSCIFADTGFGGAASFGVEDFYCDLAGGTGGTLNNGISLTYGAAFVTFHDIIVESGGTTRNGILINTGGVVNIDGWHSEGVSTPIFIDLTTSTIVRIHNVTGGGNGLCNSLITRQSGSIAGATVAGALNPNGCTNTINNAGTQTTGLVIGDVVF